MKKRLYLNSGFLCDFALDERNAEGATEMLCVFIEKPSAAALWC